MNDPKKAHVPPPIVVDFWAASHAKARRKTKRAIDAMVQESLELIVRQRSGPILDTIVRLTLAEEWNAPLEQILREADVLSDQREFKR